MFAGGRPEGQGLGSEWCEECMYNAINEFPLVQHKVEIITILSFTHMRRLLAGKILTKMCLHYLMNLTFRELSQPHRI